MARPRPEAAFMAAALVLLVLPLLTIIVLGVFGAAATNFIDRQTFTVLLAASVVLVLLVTAAVLAVVRRLSRPERS